MILKVGSTYILYYITPGAVFLQLGGGHICLIVKWIISLKIFSLLPGMVRQTKFIVMMIK